MNIKRTTMILAGSALCAAASIPSIGLAHADCEPSGHLIEFDPPGTPTVVSPTICGVYYNCGTQSYAINSEGTVVGSYTDANYVPHGFIRHRDGSIKPFDPPGTDTTDIFGGTVAFTVNDLGVVAGQYTIAGNVTYGFIRHPGGNYDSGITVPLAPTASNPSGVSPGTVIYSLNLIGDTAGVYYDSEFNEHGFYRSANGVITPFDPVVGGTFTMVCEETCLNIEGTTVGFYGDSGSAVHGFIRSKDGKITTFDAPGATTNVAYQGTIAASITDAGEIGGYYVDSSGAYHGFIRHRDGSFQTVNVPKGGTAAGQGTAPFAINLSGALTGIYIDSKGTQHGFERSAYRDTATIDAKDGPGATRPSTNNDAGEVTGWYVDSGGLYHGFVWTP